MGLDTLLTGIVTGVFTLGILSILFAPNSPLASVIGSVASGLSNVVTSAKSVPH